jgi:hypothetical protein
MCFLRRAAFRTTVEDWQYFAWKYLQAYSAVGNTQINPVHKKVSTEPKFPHEEEEIN